MPTKLGITEGDWVKAESRRGWIQARARLTGIKDGIVFAPFHYGYWDAGQAAPRRPPARRQRADGDRVGPRLEAADLQGRGSQAREGRRRRRPRTCPDGRCVGAIGESVTRFGHAIRRAEDVEIQLAAAYRRIAKEHEDEPDVVHLCSLFADEAETQANRLAALAGDHGDSGGEPLAFLDDLLALYLDVQKAWIHATILRQSALAKRDPQTLAAADSFLLEAGRQAKWLTTRIKTTAPQALTVE